MAANDHTKTVMAKNSGKKNPLSGVIAGIGLLIIGTVILWMNEHDYVENMKAVKDVSETVIDVSSETADPANNGKLVCLNGDFIIPDETVEDPEFSVGTKTAKLYRIVEVCQWSESEDDDSYSYKKEWSEDLIDSSAFHETGHKNPDAKAYENKSFCISKAEIGAFTLSGEQLENLETNETFTISSSVALPQGYQVSDNYITNAKDMNNPNVGDIRIRYEYNTFSTATVLAVQDNNSFVDYISANGIAINRVDEGNLNGSQVVNKMTDENNALKWALRLIGSIAVMLGYVSLVGPISRLASFVPLLGGLVGFVLSLAAAAVGLIHSFIVIAIAWFVFRPVFSILLIAVAAVIGVAVFLLIKKKKPAPETEERSIA